MSRLVVDTLQGRTSGGNTISIPSGHVLHAPGHIIQVAYTVNAANTTQQSTTSTTFVEVPGYSVTITPKYANSKLMITGKMHVYVSGGTSPWAVTTCYRDGVDISSSTYRNGYIQGDIYVGVVSAFGYVVDASSTTASTFKMYYKIGGGGATTLQMDRGDIFMSVMEIAQ